VKCPDCGSMLAVQPTTAGQMMRCFKCGGFWLDANTANNLTAKEVDTFRRISINSTFLSGGSGVCPAEGQRLVKYSGEQVPMNVVVERCDRCGKWWFPGDNLYKFKPALEAKRNYLRLWGLPMTTGILLPLILLAILAGGAVVGVRMVREEQRTRVEAALKLKEFSVNYTGGGKAVVVFKTPQAVSKIDYRMKRSGGWRTAEVEVINEYKAATLTNIVEGETYIIRILGWEYEYKAN